MGRRADPFIDGPFTVEPMARSPGETPLLAARQAAAWRALAQCEIPHEDRSRRTVPVWAEHAQDPDQWAGAWTAHVHNPADGFDEQAPLVLHLRFARQSPVLRDVYAKTRSGAFIGNDVSDAFLLNEQVRHEQAILRASIEPLNTESPGLALDVEVRPRSRL